MNLVLLMLFDIPYIQIATGSMKEDTKNCRRIAPPSTNVSFAVERKKRGWIHFTKTSEIKSSNSKTLKLFRDQLLSRKMTTHARQLMPSSYET